MELIKKKVQIVVARYNEDVKWLLPLKDVTIIYNKGNYDFLLNNFNVINLKNYGRESHTYLYHIITNYNNLTDKVIFFQGKIDDHKILNIEDYFGRDNFIAKLNELDINSLKNNIQHIGKWKKYHKNGYMKISKYTPYYWLSQIIGINIDPNITTSNIVWGANFSLSKELILSKPIDFYKNILRYLEYHENPEEGHFLERGWYLLFNNSFNKKDKIGYINDTLNKNDNYNLDKYLDEYLDEYKEIHIWKTIVSNNEIGISHKINYTPKNIKYVIINPDIINNNFMLSIKAKNDAHILIEFNEDSIYEIVLGGWNNTISVIRDYINNKILNAYEKNLLNENKFINFDFIISDKIKIFEEGKLIFDIENIFKSNDYTIKNIKIKSNFNSDAFWNYNDSSKIKFFILNNIYENINIFYQNNYLDYYIENI